ncbi:centromere protein N-A isoform X5 [Bemisia tabaci]|uniref:centromere protein N-A isoform X5 n=1 Tax=Bemisia tabaci TaxID=7038 RepID=UPI003B28CD1B
MDHNKRGIILNKLSRTMRTFQFLELKELSSALCPELLSVSDILNKLKKAKQKLSAKAFREMALLNFKFIEVIQHTNGIFYILIQEKKIIQGKGVSLRSPVYCACDLDEPYLFVSPKGAVHNHILLRVAPSLGYGDSQVCQLEGKNILSLTQILKRRFNHHTVEEFNPVDIIRTSDGLNYCLDEERKKFAAKVFGGEEPVELQTLSVTASVPFRGLRVVPDAEGNMFKSSLKISAPNIAEFVKDLAKQRVVHMPLPPWLSKASHLGKNNFVISEKIK